MNDFPLLFLTFLYVVIILLFSFVLRRFLSEEGTRKFVHIAVSFTVFPVMLIESPLLRFTGPVVFIIVNLILGKLGGGRVLGLVLYPLSMLLLLIAGSGDLLSQAAIITGVLSMGLGDGSAALAGMCFEKGKGGKKTFAGSLCMAVVTAFVFLAFSSLPWYLCILSAVCVSSIEAITPSGFDNFTVPVAAAVLAEVL